MATKTWIYFFLIDGKRIKIGKTDNVSRRQKQHAKTTLDTHDVKLLATVQGSGADEKHIQRYFADNAVFEQKPQNNAPPEVFVPTPTLTNYIRWLRNQWFVAIDEEVPEGCVSFEQWEPSQNRQTPPAQLELFKDAEPDWLDFNDRLVTADDYYTNSIVLECARIVLGDIDLDPASHALANKNVKASTFYSIQDDGLEQQWSGRVWVNPPFSQWKLWAPKIRHEWAGGAIDAICVYCAMRTITAKYFRPFLDITNAMCIITGRMKHGGKGGNSPDDGHCVFYIGPDVNLFAKTFAEIGKVYVVTT